ncbi:MAG: 2-C-methyl-D-erythritol 4-phosphate cytidylyltransferase [Dehalococcoidia bacterium]
MPESTASLGAVIVAAGSGTRMGRPSTLRPGSGQAGSGQALDKLFIPLGGRPVLAHALAAFQECAAVQHIVLVLPAGNLERGRRFVQEHGFDKVHRVCGGGPRRQDSVRLGLEALGPCQWVAIHDGARPLITPDLIVRGLEAARDAGAAVPALPLADTVKEAGPDATVLRTLDRSRLWAVQTPQIFRYDLLLRAHQEVTADATDDAAMLEALGLPVRIFPGSRLNLKITTPEDLTLAEAILAAAAAPAAL